jgi:hypothetical protein
MTPHRVTLTFATDVQEAVWAHLRSNVDGEEEAAFLFADAEVTTRGTTLHVRGWYQVVADDFEARGMEGIVLTDACRASLFKRAHDEGRCLIECHSHPGPRTAVFSLYDFEGFSEFVPHVRWRLQGRPYAAVVVADTTFDALAWIEPGAHAPVAVDAVTTDNEILYPTRKSLVRWQEVQHGITL